MKSEHFSPLLIDDLEALPSDLPPTKGIYPVQSPYSEALEFNPTPPPEDSHEPHDRSAETLQGVVKQGVIVQGPPTPPHSSPTQSINSASSLTSRRDEVRTSAFSVDNVPMDLSSDRDQFMRNLRTSENIAEPSTVSNIQPPNGYLPFAFTSGDRGHTAQHRPEMETTEFFDFEAAALEEPFPLESNGHFPHDAAHAENHAQSFEDIRRNFENASFPQPMDDGLLAQLGGHSRKRSRVEQDEVDESALPMNNVHLPTPIKMEIPTSPEYYPPFERPASLDPSQPLGSDVFSNARPRNSWRYILTVEFPKKDGKPDRDMKSRVETQLPILLFLNEDPQPATKMRLPRYAIAKKKYIEDSLPQHPEILDMHVTVVCASAMRVWHQLERALHEARGEQIPQHIREAQRQSLLEEARESEQPRNSSDISGSTKSEEKKPRIDYDNPLFGAPVRICDQCMNRERKRAGRKKNKNLEEERKWAEDEHKRIIVFNSNQVKEWTGAEQGGVMIADTNIRICCYCRHHQEKEGFQVIFTLKDFNGTVLAQTISPRILITDDHKNANGSQQPASPQGTYITGDPRYSIDQQMNPMPPGMLYDHMPQITNAAFGLPHSPSEHLSNTPGSSSRSSPSPGHPTKRRKPSKVSNSLAMTPVDSSQFHQNLPVGMVLDGQPWNQEGAMNAQGWPAANGPLTPQNLSSVSAQESYPNLTWGSSAESSNGFMLSSPVSAQITSVASTPKSNSRPAPLTSGRVQDATQIHRVVPGEGPCRGGTEISILGKNFVPGLTVMFDDRPTPASYFSDSCLTCLTPPAQLPGRVQVKLKHLETNDQEPPVFFNYIDDVDPQLMALALEVIGMKMQGENRRGSSREVALSILHQSGRMGSYVPTSGSRGAQESDLLACLDLMDNYESPHQTRLDLKNESGHTMLHLASILGMTKFVAALLARGASPNSRDRNGYTPLHFAALYNKSDVLRRLLLSRAKPGLRTWNGETAADLGQSDEIVRATREVGQIHSRSHSRSNSISSDTHNGRSRSGSIVSMPNMLQHRPRGTVDEFYDSSDEIESSEASGDSSEPSTEESGSEEASGPVEGGLEHNVVKENKVVDDKAQHTQVPSPGAVYAAWREQVATSIQALQQNWQQNMHQWNMPTAADYQHIIQTHMARFQIQNPMARWNFSPSLLQQRDNSEYKWSELFSPPAPPAYDELYPDKMGPSTMSAGGVGGEVDEKVALDMKAATETVVENIEAGPSTPPARPFLTRTPSPKVSEQDLKEIHRRIALGDHSLSGYQKEAYAAHARKMKRIQSDRRLYFFWLPVLIFILIAMSYSWGPKLWHTSRLLINFGQEVMHEPHTARQRFREVVTGILNAPT